MKNTKKVIRWKKWDYSSTGAYFITICTKDLQTFFGRIKPTEEINFQDFRDSKTLTSYFDPSEIGQVAWENWQKIPTHYSFVHLDAFVIMPNHLHGILIFDKEPNESWNPNRFGPQKNNLPDVIRSFKGSVTKIANEIEQPFQWQSRYNDRVIRNEEEMERIRNYIWQNPVKWAHRSRSGSRSSS